MDTEKDKSVFEIERSIYNEEGHVLREKLAWNFIK